MSMTSDPDSNLQRAIERVTDAASQGAEIVCLPELFQTQYFCQREDTSLFDLAEPIPGPTSTRLSETAKQLGIVLIASLFEKRAAGVYHNTAAMFDADGTLRGLYRKMHIPDDPLYYEKYYFTPGDLGFRAFDTSVGRV
ncbi:MAG TPA: nitrilase-related carbon-nitrogen hydrolase, partial [Terriglobales bacterium]|nr:nitrilase-related carbon-nitrogen hydrolase [Terriglobales bacterium]